MSVFSKAIESIIKSFGKEAGQKAGQSASKNASLKSSKATQTKPASTPAQKQIHKEQRGIYNVTYNGKNATMIYKDLESIESAIAYAGGNRFKGGKHIRIKHSTDSKQQGYITPDEVANLGKNIRNYINKHGDPHIDKNGSRIYERKNDKGEKFRAVVNDIKTSRTDTLPASASEEIITFYSNRNLPKDKIFEFKNPKLQEINLQKTKSQEAKIKEANLQNPLDSTPKTSFTRQ
ncbi:hypothetical protein [Helicobacter sp. T3_23-1056]